MNIANNKALAGASLQQQIVHTAMMMDPKMIPEFNANAMQEANNVGAKIQSLFDQKLFTKMYLDNDGKVVLL